MAAKCFDLTSDMFAEEMPQCKPASNQIVKPESMQKPIARHGNRFSQPIPQANNRRWDYQLGEFENEY